MSGAPIQPPFSPAHQSDTREASIEEPPARRRRTDGTADAPSILPLPPPPAAAAVSAGATSGGSGEYSGSSFRDSDVAGKIDRLIAKTASVLKPEFFSDIGQFVVVQGAGTYINAIYHPPAPRTPRGAMKSNSDDSNQDWIIDDARSIDEGDTASVVTTNTAATTSTNTIAADATRQPPQEVTLVLYGYSDVDPDINSIYADIRASQGRRGVQSRALLGVMRDTPAGIAPGKLSRYQGAILPVIVRSRVSPPPVPRLNALDYHLNPTPLCNGGWGVVHQATHLRTRTTVAMKFFGYLQLPSLTEIQREIELMRCLAGLPGVIKLYGTFDDVRMGYCINKKHLYSFPVIVMELVRGGDLLKFINERFRTLNERVIADIFRGFIEGLRGIHARGYIHRDIKLQNIMVSDELVVKIIDFGLMIPAPPKDSRNGIVMLGVAAGTLGYMAPETLHVNAYSVHTDTYQAGVVLYILLSGTMPYDAHSAKIEDLLSSGMYDGLYKPMVGPRWDRVSTSAKALVAKMLQRYGVKRPSLDDILADPWVANAAATSSTAFDEAYVARIRGLAARKDLQRMVLGDIRQEQCDLLNHATIVDSKYNARKGRDVLTTERVLALKKALLGLRGNRAPLAIQRSISDSSMSTGVSTPTSSSGDGSGSSANSSTDASDDILSIRVNRAEFNSVMRSIELDVLACDKVFNIFIGRGSAGDESTSSSSISRSTSSDIDSSTTSSPTASASTSGPTIQLKDLLLTSLSLAFGRDTTAHFEALFDIFDFNGDGSICRTELRGALAMYPDIFLSESSQDAAFDAMDTDRDGSISKEEFSRFFYALCNECTRA